MIKNPSKIRRPRSTNSRRIEIREVIARRLRQGEPLTLRAILHESGGTFKTIREELELAGVRRGVFPKPNNTVQSSECEETLRQQVSDEQKRRVAAEIEAKTFREMYEEVMGRIEFYLRKWEERAVSGGTPQVVVKEVPVRDELTEAKVRRLMNENGVLSKKIESLLVKLREYDPDAD